MEEEGCFGEICLQDSNFGPSACRGRADSAAAIHAWRGDAAARLSQPPVLVSGGTPVPTGQHLGADLLQMARCK